MGEQGQVHEPLPVERHLIEANKAAAFKHCRYDHGAEMQNKSALTTVTQRSPEADQGVGRDGQLKGSMNSTAG